MLGYEDIYDNYLNNFKIYLDKYFLRNDGNIPREIFEPMKYAVADGGKRIRPVLCLAVADMLGISRDKVLNYCLAIEFIHSYSLVHDDLPCMDNDDYRRGKLSTHKKYGEAMGVLIGDALLNTAFELCLNKNDSNQNDIKAMRIITNCAGASGMIAGQVGDMAFNNQEGTENDLLNIYINKTSKLIMCSVLVPSILANNKYYYELKEFAMNLGILFQITDDILDEESSLSVLGKTPHKDKEENKLTSIKIFGLDGAKAQAEEYYERCLYILECVNNSEFLSEFTTKLYNRKK
ncbi:MAG: polyprenyl synthetase family protein [Clostridia bacterium]|nr:polyprenyl synthetase family protein [Clostridia bacterium]